MKIFTPETRDSLLKPNLGDPPWYARMALLAIEDAERNKEPLPTREAIIGPARPVTFGHQGESPAKREYDAAMERNTSPPYFRRADVEAAHSPVTNDVLAAAKRLLSLFQPYLLAPDVPHTFIDDGNLAVKGEVNDEGTFMLYIRARRPSPSRK